MSDLLPSWREGATKQSIVEFVDAVTDPNSEAFVPEVERIAVFDNDGTLSHSGSLCPVGIRVGSCGATREADELRAVEGGGSPACSLVRLTHGGITTDESNTAVRTWLITTTPPPLWLFVLSDGVSTDDPNS